MEETFLDYITKRGFYNQCTNDFGLKKLLKNKTVAYAGFDCTADSLHIGSLVQIMLLRTFQKFGHQPIILLGGGTSLIGDPSGKEETRKILKQEHIKHNKEKLEDIFKKFLDFDNKSNGAIILDNHGWLSKLNYINFLREVGSQFSVNKMLSFESVKQRLKREQNLSFLEFNYVLFQSFDFLKLYSDNNCKIQFGGSDQWGNIISGIDLIKKKKKVEVYGLTSPLITTSSGEKMGKTNDGAIWLSEEKLSAYEYWQFWRNVEDNDVFKFLRLFTEVSESKIKQYERFEGSDINKAKVLLANEVTKICHGEKKSKEAEITSKKIFSKKIDLNIPTKHIYLTNLKEIEKGLLLKNILIKINFSKSIAESKRLILNGGIKINNVKILDKEKIILKENFNNQNVCTISLGKKKYGILKF